MKKVNDDYVEKAKNLNEEEVERLQSRMRVKLTLKVENKKLSPIDALAMQLEFEDEQLAEWREKRNEINEKYRNT